MHVYRHHRAAVGLDSDGTIMNTSDETGTATECTDLTATVASKIVEPETPGGGEHSSMQLSTRGNAVSRTDNIHYAAKFLLRLREGRQLSQVAVSEVMDGCKALCKQTVDKFKERIEVYLASAGIGLEDIPGVQDICAEDPDPFKGIETNYLYETFCIEHL